MKADSGSAAWRKSSHSANHGECVEVAPVAGVVGVRDTKDRTRGHLTVSRAAWRAFAGGAARHELHADR